MPPAVSPGDDVYMRCKYNLDADQLYTVKWYKGRQEFFRYVPKELPNTKVFPLPGINVDVSIHYRYYCTFRKGLSPPFCAACKLLYEKRDFQYTNRMG